MRAVMAFLALGRLTKSSRALNRPESTFFRTENRAVMGFNKKDLGDSSGAPKPAEIPYFFHHVPRISTTPNSSQYKHSTAEQRGDAFPNGTSPLYSFRASPSRNGVQANQYQCVKE